ncbi:MAG: OmpA family protein [Verrucomicrobiota bacterium]
MNRKILAQTLVLAIAVSTLTGCAWWNKHILHKKDVTTGSQPGGIGSTSIDSKVGDRVDLTNEGSRGEFTPVYFDYDSAKIKPSEFTKLEAVASALKGNSKKLVVEGNTDERGTAEYNRALGEKRALAARQALISLGIDGARISTVSYGKDRPVEMSHDDTAWSRNRRDEFVTINQ